MYWTCPHCSKEFAKANQSHNCISISRDVVLADKTPAVVELVDVLVYRLKERFDFTETTSAKALTMYSPNKMAFLILSPKRKWLDIWFPYEEPLEAFQIFKVMQRSKNRWVHFIRFYEPEDIDDFALDLIAKGYEFICAKG